ncbi:MAG: corrinoid protein [Caldilineaceae bacterium]|nr:corrinoid protein [Caldilineaceae bacterium]
MSYAELSLEDLYLQMQDDLYDGIKEEIPLQVREALGRGESPQSILDQGLVAGMDIVGVDFRDGILFVPEVLMAANAMKSGMEVLRPLLTETGAQRIGTIVIGTVKGDIHDIGKNLVSMMMEGAGFEVINLGINVDADGFIAAIHEHKPDIIGMSALLTTTMPYMKVVVDALGEEGLRDEIYVMVGGAPVTENFAREVGADAYGRDAAVSVEIAKRHMAKKNAAAV